MLAITALLAAPACLDELPPTTVAADAASAPQPDAAPPAALPAIDFDDYHTQDEIAAYLRAVADARPELVSFHVLGSSYEGSELAYVVIDATGRADAPAIFANGTHHGDEKSATESTLALIDHVLRHPDDPDVAEVLDSYTIYVLPLVNPDGHAHDTRWDVFGRDPNRDYSYPERSDAASFELVEIQLVKELQDDVQFRGAVAYHSGIEEVVWPWGFTADAPEHADELAAVSWAACDAMGFDRCLQAYFDYPTQGEYVDYAYWRHGTLAVTMEVSEVKTPPPAQLAGVVDRAVTGTLAYMVALDEVDSGRRAAPPAPRQRPAPSVWIHDKLE